MAQKKINTDIGKMEFEEAIESLTGIVNKIESGETPLQASLEQYERGMSLISHCREILQAAEKRIEKIAGSDEKSEKEEVSAANNDKDKSEDSNTEELF